MNESFILKALGAGVNTIHQAGKKDNERIRAEVRYTHNGALIAMGFGADEESAKRDAIAAAQKAKNIPDGPETDSDRVNARIADLEAKLGQIEEAVADLALKVDRTSAKPAPPYDETPKGNRSKNNA